MLSLGSLIKSAGGLIRPAYFVYGLVAQWIEHPPSKRAVTGSNPVQSVFL